MSIGLGIGKSSGEDAVSLGSQTWNIADGYTKIKILRLIIQLDIDEEVATFGKRDDHAETPENQIPYVRVESFEKFIFHLRQVIGNCRFSIERGFDEKVIESYLNRLEQVEKVSDGIAYHSINQITNEETLVINEPHFKNCMKILHNIKDELNFPINRAGLIFRQGEEMDIDAIMRTVEEGGLWAIL